MYKPLNVFFLHTAPQQAHIPASIMVVLEGEKKAEPKPVEPVVEKEAMDEDKMVFPPTDALILGQLNFLKILKFTFKFYLWGGHSHF